MRLDPNYLSSLVASLDQNGANQQRLSAQISSGVRVAGLGDDAAAAAQNVLLSSRVQADSSFTQVASSTTGALQVTDATLGAVVEQINRALSIATAGTNGTESAANLASVAGELDGIRGEVLSLANTTYGGSYLFSGSQGGVEPFHLDTTTIPATVVYHGDAQVNFATTPSGQKIALNVPGQQIFSASGGDLLGTLSSVIDAFSKGDTSSTAALTPQLTAALRQVSQQRMTIDNSINRLQSASSYAVQERTQLLADQTNLLQADLPSVAIALSSSQTQQSALESVIVSLEKQGTLFDRM